jgi:hypothetical protein
MVAARRNRFSNVLENLFQPVGPVILSGHDRKRRKDFTDCAQGSLHSPEPLWEQRQKTHYMPTVAAGAIRAQINGMMIAPTVINRINKNHTN